MTIFPCLILTKYLESSVFLLHRAPLVLRRLSNSLFWAQYHVSVVRFVPRLQILETLLLLRCFSTFLMVHGRAPGLSASTWDILTYFHLSQHPWKSLRVFDGFPHEHWPYVQWKLTESKIWERKNSMQLDIFYLREFYWKKGVAWLESMPGTNQLTISTWAGCGLHPIWDTDCGPLDRVRLTGMNLLVVHNVRPLFQRFEGSFLSL